MRISRFDMRAFGHFTDVALDFSSIRGDLHVIYGPNEAGKSSALRALKAWLFGFPERTADDFFHPRARLQVGGELVESEQRICFYRLKKRKGNIIDHKGDILAPELLTPFLGGLDLALFESLHGIDHAGLVLGGRNMLEQEGEIGETLFSAGAGLASLHQVVSALEQEKNELFRPRASKPAINQALSKHKKLQKEVRDLLLLPEQWQEHADKLQQLERELEQTQLRRRKLEHKRRVLERLDRAAPLLARRKKLIEQQQALGIFCPLPSDFTTRRKYVQQELRTTGLEYQQLQLRHEQVNQQLARLSPQETLLLHKARIEELHQRLGAYDKARQDRPRIQGMRAVHIKEAEQVLAVIAPHLTRQDSQQLYQLVRQKKRILGLVSSNVARSTTAKDCAARQRRIEEQLRELDSQAQQGPDPEDIQQLQAAVDQAKQAGDLDGVLTDYDQKIRELEQKVQLRLQQLGHWQGSCDQLLALVLPSGAEIEEFRTTMERLERQQESLEKRKTDFEDERCQLDKQKQELIHAGEIPSEQELHAIRQRRDEGWNLLYRQWIQQEDVEQQSRDFADEDSVADTVEGLIHKADVLSDALRFQASRVHAFATIQASEDTLQTQLAQTIQLLQQTDKELANLQEKWEKLWHPSGVVPALPADMARWRVEILQLQQVALEREKSVSLLTAAENQQQSLFDTFTTVLPKCDLTGRQLAPILREAEALLADRKQAEAAHLEVFREMQSLKRQLRELESTVQQLDKERADWQKEWQKVALLPGQEKPFASEEAHDLFDMIDKVQTGLGQADELKRRMDGIDRDSQALEEDVRTLTADIAPDLTDKPVKESIQHLYLRLASAGREQAFFEQYEQENQELQEKLQKAKQAREIAGQELQKLLAMAGCTKEEELARAEQCVADHRRLAEQLEQVEQDLQQIGGDMELAELSRQVQAADIDSLPGKITDLTTEIETGLDPAIQALAEQKGEAGKVLEHMDGSRAAAQKAEELEGNLAELRQKTEEYVRLQLGVDMLHREIEAFRRRNQGPVLRDASAIFATLTGGAFQGLKTDLNERGLPVVVGIRSESTRPVGVEAMSTGSRDQLYLALRLASLRHRADQGRAMPFIVDDILINFDEERTAATLEVLAEHSQTEQVILFTHHAFVASLAKTVDGAQVHPLPPRQKGVA